MVILCCYIYKYVYGKKGNLGTQLTHIAYIYLILFISFCKNVNLVKNYYQIMVFKRKQILYFAVIMST